MSQAQIPPLSPSATEAGDPRAGISPLFVRTMICLIAVLTLGMVSLIFYRSQSISEPTCAVLVAGDPSLDGAIVEVFADQKQIASATLSSENQFITPVLLQPGVYELHVTINGHVLLADKFGVQSLRFASFSLPTAVVVQGDPSMGGAVVRTWGSDRDKTTILGAENSYTALSYFLPGKYHLTVVRDGHVLRDQPLTVAAHKPRRILLSYQVDPSVFFNQDQ